MFGSAGFPTCVTHPIYGRSIGVMTDIVRIPLEPLSLEAFTPFGQLIAAQPRRPDWDRPPLQAWTLAFDADAAARIQVMRYGDRTRSFAIVERHLHVTESRFPLTGSAAIFAVAPATPAGMPPVPPSPGSFRAFLLDGNCGLILHKGVWHSLTCFPVGADTVDFGLISDVATEAEFDGGDIAAARRTQIYDYLAEQDRRFVVTDPKGLCGS